MLSVSFANSNNESLQTDTYFTCSYFKASVLKKIFLFLLIVCCNVLSISAQPKFEFSNCNSYDDSILYLTKVCDKELNAENSAQLIATAKECFKYLKQNDAKSKSLFYFFIGAGFSQNIDSAIFYYKKSHSFALQANDLKRILEAEGRLLDAYNSSLKYTSQQDSLAAILHSRLDTLSNPNNKLTVLNALASYYHQQGLYDNEINSLLQQVALLKKRQNTDAKNSADSANIGVAYFNIGGIYLLQKSSKAKEYYQASRPYFTNYKSGFAYYFKGMTDAYLLEGDTTSALQEIDSLELMSVENKEQSVVLAATFLSMSYHYLETRNFDRVAYYLQKAKTSYQHFPDETLLPEMDYLQGKILLAKKQYQQSLQHLLKAEKFVDNISVERKLDITLALAQCYNELGNWQLSNHYYQQYIPLRDSVYTIASKQSIANAEARFQNNEKTQTIKLQNQQLAFKEKQKIAFLIGFILAVLLAVMFIINFQNKKKKAAVLKVKNDELAAANYALNEANQTKAQLFTILSHDLRSPVSSLYSYLQLKNIAPQMLSEEQRQEKERQLQQSAGHLLETMEDLLIWSKSQLESFTPERREISARKIVDNVLNIYQPYIDAKQLNLLLPNHDINIVTDENMLQTILRNIIANAVKHTPNKGTIEIKMDIEQKTISLFNTGKAIDEVTAKSIFNWGTVSSNQHGYGLKMSKALADKMGIRLSLHQQKEGNIFLVRL